jgi:hypothetical protein
MITNPMDIEKKSITDQQHWCEPRVQIVQWGLLGSFWGAYFYASNCNIFKKNSSRFVEEYWCYLNYGP